jgi:hypothetical protein
MANKKRSDGLDPEVRAARTAAFREECKRRRLEGLTLSRGTFAWKKDLKAAGAVWDAHDRCWLLPDLTTFRRFRRLVGPQAADLGPRTLEPCEPCGRTPSFRTDMGLLCAACLRPMDL